MDTPQVTSPGDDVLDNITLYWLTSTAVSSARLYWENKHSLYNDADVSVPAAVSVFPGENYQAPRSWQACDHSLFSFVIMTERRGCRSLPGRGTAVDPALST